MVENCVFRYMGEEYEAAPIFKGKIIGVNVSGSYKGEYITAMVEDPEIWERLVNPVRKNEFAEARRQCFEAIREVWDSI